MIYFVSDQKPLSIQATRCQAYKKRLQEEFSKIASLYPSLPLRNELYSKLVYIHSARTDLDVDNMSKPLVDAFNGVMYSDDAIINHRICSKIMLDDLSSYRIPMDSLPRQIGDAFSHLIRTNSPHILYFEVGTFTPDMVFTGERA